jgi:hypothetical protein
MMTKKILVLLVVLAVPLAMMATASAGPPCAKNPTHPDCVGPPPSSTTTTTIADDGPVGLTCAEAEEDGFDHVPVRWSEDRTSFEVELNLRTGACVDVDSVEGEWTIDVDVGSARELRVAIQDSVAPGDACWGGCNGDVEAIVTESGTIVTPVIPAATLDACGTGFPDGADTLTFSASYSGVRKLATPVTVTVSLP